MRDSICIASLALILAAGSLRADGPFLRQGNTSDLHLLPIEEDLGKLVSRGDEARLHHPGPTTRRIADWLIEQRRKGDGRGGNVSGLLVIQADFSHPTMGNVALVVWTEDAPNLSNIVLSIEDENGEVRLEGPVPPLAGGQIPGTNSVFVENVPEGMMTFMVEGDGEPMTAETEMVILAEQPFADVENFTCAEGETNDAGNCDMFLIWDSPTPLPSYHLVLLDGSILGQTASGAVDNVNVGLVNADLLPPGDYQATNLGFLETPEADDNLYRGGFVTTSCTLECSNLTCIAPVNLTACQSSYSADEDNQLRVSWVNLGAYIGIDVFVDGELNQDLLPDGGGQIPEIIDILGVLPPGDHTIGLQAVCDGEMAADPVETTITILDATPHVAPIEGDLSCEFVLGDPGANPPIPDQTVLTWTNADPSSFFDIWVQNAQEVFYLGAAPGDLETITINSTTPADIVFLQFFRETADGDCHGSDFFFCQPPPPGNIFIRGDCNGSGGPPQITTAVFGLNVLFAGEIAPCLEACDANGDGNVNISDMVGILTFLFGGGSPPAGWVDALTPVCETSTGDCETGLESCPL